MTFETVSDLFKEKKIFYIERKGDFMALHLFDGNIYFAEKDEEGKIHVYNGINDREWDNLNEVGKVYFA